MLPSLAVAEELRERGVKVTFAGSPDRVEARLVPEAGFELDAFRVSGLPRRPSPALVRASVWAVCAPVACLRILARRRPDVVLGGGGYVAGPMVLAAWTRRIPAALTEADAHMGLANRLAAPYARRVFLAYELPDRHARKYRVVGRPIPARSKPIPQDEARGVFGLPLEGPVLAVFGALAGARSLNELVVEAFGLTGPGQPEHSSAPAVLHLSGRRDYDALRARVSREGYVLLSETDQFGAAISAADLVLARAGGSVWEIAAAARPAVLVPYPYATGDHQAKNARHFEDAGGAICVPETELGRVPELVRSLLDDPTRRARMGEAMRRAARPNAAAEIADELVELASERAA